MTVERTTAVGFGSSVARIGGLLAPQVLYFGKINQLLPGKFLFANQCSELNTVNSNI